MNQRWLGRKGGQHKATCIENGEDITERAKTNIPLTVEITRSGSLVRKICIGSVFLFNFSLSLLFNVQVFNCSIS
jgi:hypothetical protein